MKSKKLQVFVSSTYKDLLDERQIAVLSILSSGHIPAGMELFTAGDESQWNVIKRWIEESDVFLLILGGRYGAIEPNSGKSYTQLEYEYALNLKIPHFAVVIRDDALEEKVKMFGSSVIETENTNAFKEFKKLVLSKMVKFFSDQKDIKLAVYETMAEFSSRKELVGWVRSNNSINSDQVAQQLSYLSEENQLLRTKLSNLNSVATRNDPLYNGLTFDEIIEMLSSTEIPKSKTTDAEIQLLDQVKDKLGLSYNSMLVFLLAYLKKLGRGIVDSYNSLEGNACDELVSFGIVESIGRDNRYFRFNEEGRKLYLKLLIKYASVLNE